jgi:hypothetical protein
VGLGFGARGRPGVARTVNFTLFTDGDESLGKTREFEYKGKHVKVSATKTAQGAYLGIPIIDGSVPKVGGMADGKRTVNEALGEAERKARDFIDAQG